MAAPLASAVVTAQNARALANTITDMVTHCVRVLDDPKRMSALLARIASRVKAEIGISLPPAAFQPLLISLITAFDRLATEDTWVADAVASAVPIVSATADLALAFVSR